MGETKRAGHRPNSNLLSRMNKEKAVKKVRLERGLAGEDEKKKRSNVPLQVTNWRRVVERGGQRHRRDPEARDRW